MKILHAAIITGVVLSLVYAPPILSNKASATDTFTDPDITFQDTTRRNKNKQSPDYKNTPKNKNRRSDTTYRNRTDTFYDRNNNNWDTLR